MARYNRTYSDKNRNLVGNLPKWSLGYTDPNSNVSKIINPFGNTFNVMEKDAEEINSEAAVINIDPDKFPYKRWEATYLEVLSYDEDSSPNKNEFLVGLVSINGIISGTTIPLIQVETDSELYDPHHATAWYVADEIPHLVSGEFGDISLINDELKIVLVSGETYDPGQIVTSQLPNRWIPNIDRDNSYEIIDTSNDPGYSTVQLEVVTTQLNQRVLLDHQLYSMSGKITVFDNVQTRASGEPIEINTGFSFVDTSNYKVRNVSTIDLDNDGIVDQKELDLITAEFGKNRRQYTTEDWTEIYSSYDFNSNGIIDEEDKNVVLKYQNTIARDVTAMSFDNVGSYTVSYDYPTGNAGVTKVLDVNGSTEYFRNESYGYLTPVWEDGFVSATYDLDKEAYYILDNNAKCIWAYEFSEDLDNYVEDRFKIILPILSGDMELRGIEYSNHRIYVLAISNGVAKIIIISTNINNPEDEIYTTSVHSGNTVDSDIIIRDEIGLTEYASGLAMYNDSKLLTIDGPDIKVLLPLYDYYEQNTNDGGFNVLHFREKYDSLDVSPSGTIEPVYRNLWNRLDAHAVDKGLTRLPHESNETFKERILDVFVHFPSREKQGSLYGIQRDLGIPIQDITNESLIILNEPINNANADTLTIIESGIIKEYDDIEIIPQYNYGKYTHDLVRYYNSGDVILEIDKDIVTRNA